jgi:tRNA pseudouridine38-40 synthase
MIPTRSFLVFFTGITFLSAASNSWSTRLATPITRRSCSFHTSSILRQTHNGIETNKDTSPIAPEETTAPLTSAILRVTYDGSRFTGWSAANDPKPGSPEARLLSPRQRRRGRNRRSNLEPPIKGYVRSVQGILKLNLAKVYGNLDPELIVVESSSRTDKGVHATGMIAMIYGLHQHSWDMTSADNHIPGKPIPHPKNATDSTWFRPVPMDLSKLAFTLNRMLPPDVRIVGIAPTPTTTTLVFHPSISVISKTYVYTFAATDTQKNLLDPTARRIQWNVAGNEFFDLEKAQEACRILQGTHNFSAFQGAPRGSSDREKRQREDGICTLFSITLHPISTTELMPTATSYRLMVRGDRFLYKMVRFLAGSIVDVGLGKASIERLEQALTQQQHERFSCAPAHGLVLQEVSYNTTFDWKPLHN